MYTTIGNIWPARLLPTLQTTTLNHWVIDHQNMELNPENSGDKIPKLQKQSLAIAAIQFPCHSVD